MDYSKIYEQLMLKAKTRDYSGYTEKHHIVPRCQGGSDDISNIAKLTPEEHYVAHQLLVKIHPESTALARAAGMMCMGRPTNKLYGWLRRRMAEAISRSHKGKKLGPMSDSRKKKLSRAMKGKNTAPKSVAHRAAIGAAQLGKKRGPYKKRKQFAPIA